MDTFNARSILELSFTVSVALAIFQPVSTRAQDIPALSEAKPAIQVAPRIQPVLHEGDKLKLVFFERLENEEDKWRGRSGSIPRSFHQRAELSGDYLVSEDGTVSLPMLGRFQAAGLTQDAFIESLSKPFEALIERKGFVNVTEIERRPVYVIGPVKTPGSFRFEPGMTVLHVLALAGGVREREAETWQRVEFGREIDRLQRTLDRAKRLIARAGVLQSERDGTPVPKGEMASLMGKAQTASLVGEETWQRNLTTMSRGAQEAAMKTALSNATSELVSRSERLTPLDATIAMRVERVKSLSSLADKNIIGRPVLIQAQSELSDAQDRRNQANLEVEAARKRVDDSERDLARFHLEQGVEVGRATTLAKREAADTLDEGQGLLDVVKALATDRNAPGQSDLEYEIVRRTAGGTALIPAAPTDGLEPGDLVRLRVPERSAASSEVEEAPRRVVPGAATPAAPRLVPAAVDLGSSSAGEPTVRPSVRESDLSPSPVRSRPPAITRPLIIGPGSRASISPAPLPPSRPLPRALAANDPAVGKAAP